MSSSDQSDASAPDFESGGRDARTDRNSSVGSCRKIHFLEAAALAVIMAPGRCILLRCKLPYQVLGGDSDVLLDTSAI